MCERCERERCDRESLIKRKEDEALNRMYGYKRECYALLHLNSGIVLYMFTNACCSFFFLIQTENQHLLSGK